MVGFSDLLTGLVDWDYAYFYVRHHDQFRGSTLKRTHTARRDDSGTAPLMHATAPGTSAIFDFLWKEVRNLEKYIKNENKSPQTSKRVWGKLEMWRRKAREGYDHRLQISSR